MQKARTAEAVRAFCRVKPLVGRVVQESLSDKEEKELLLLYTRGAVCQLHQEQQKEDIQDESE